jgi:hypothetical protein
VKRSSVVVMAVVTAFFLLSWFLKARAMAGVQDQYILQGFLVTLSAFLTLSILSFLYRDNPFYKFAEHLFVGVSAAFWMCLGFKVPYIKGETFYGFYINYFFFLPVVLGILLLMRLSHRVGWISRWALAFIVGTTAGLNFVRYLRSDFIEQISSTFVPLLGTEWHGVGDFAARLDLSATGQLAALVTNWVIFVGVFSGLVYFFFSKEHKGAFGGVSRVGIWILMITFGASFGYTVMGRISLLVGRLTFLYRDWLQLVN